MPYINGERICGTDDYAPAINWALSQFGYANLSPGSWPVKSQVRVPAGRNRALTSEGARIVPVGWPVTDGNTPVVQIGAFIVPHRNDTLEALSGADKRLLSASASEGATSSTLASGSYSGGFWAVLYDQTLITLNGGTAEAYTEYSNGELVYVTVSSGTTISYDSWGYDGQTSYVRGNANSGRRTVTPFTIRRDYANTPAILMGAGPWISHNVTIQGIEVVNDEDQQIEILMAASLVNGLVIDGFLGTNYRRGLRVGLCRNAIVRGARLYDAQADVEAGYGVEFVRVTGGYMQDCRGYGTLRHICDTRTGTRGVNIHDAQGICTVASGGSAVVLGHGQRGKDLVASQIIGGVYCGNPEWPNGDTNIVFRDIQDDTYRIQINANSSNVQVIDCAVPCLEIQSSDNTADGVTRTVPGPVTVTDCTLAAPEGFPQQSLAITKNDDSVITCPDITFTRVSITPKLTQSWAVTIPALSSGSPTLTFNQGTINGRGSKPGVGYLGSGSISATFTGVSFTGISGYAFSAASASGGAFSSTGSTKNGSPLVSGDLNLGSMSSSVA
ncbi:MAG: hypothetical protein ACOYOL_07120 [Chthoniobacterales bacterium]